MKTLLAIVPLIVTTMLFPVDAVNAAEKINYMTAGGVYLENIRKAYLEPVGKKLGVEWTVETSDEDTAVRMQVRSNAMTTTSWSSARPSARGVPLRACTRSSTSP